MEFKKWLNVTYKDNAAKNDYLIKHYIPNVDLEISNFEEFVEKRTELLHQKLKSIV